MNKLYALTILFLWQSICAMEVNQEYEIKAEQSKPRVFSFFNGGRLQDGELPQTSLIEQHVKPDELNVMTDEQKKDWYFNFCLEGWKKRPFAWGKDYPTTSDQSSWTKEARDALKKRRNEIRWSAMNYSHALEFSKIIIANYASYVTIDPILQAAANKIPSIANKSPITVRDLSVPIASFLLGAGIEGADLALGHALFNKKMKRKLSIDDRSRYSEYKEIVVSLEEGARDFKAAATVSLLRILADQTMRLTGVHDELNKLKSNSKLAQEVCGIVSCFGRPAMQLIVWAFLNRSNCEKYTNQPNCPN